MWRPGGGASRLTYRLLGDLLDRLPTESALRTEMRDAMDPGAVAQVAKQATRQRSGGPWSRTEYLLAEVIDGLRDVGFRVVRVHTNKVKAWEPYPRPGVMTKNDMPHTAEAHAAAAQHVADIEAERIAHAKRRAAVRAQRQREQQAAA